MKYWEKLLLSQRTIGKHRITIPFIIGSQNFQLQKVLRMTLETILNKLL